jgi:hypothetical protein
MVKQAGPISEAVLGIPTGALTNVATGAAAQGAVDKYTDVSPIANAMFTPKITNSVTGAGANIAGYLSGEVSDEELKKMNESPGKGAIPFNPAYRYGRRLRRTVDKSPDRQDAIRNILGEFIGPTTSTVTTALAGAGIGAGIGGAAGALRNRDSLEDAKEGARIWSGEGARVGAVYGGMAGLAAFPIAMMLAVAKKRRTEAEQAEHDSEYRPANTLVPGYGLYNSLKRPFSTGTPNPKKFSEW